MDYSPFDIAVWLTFIGFCAITWLAVKVFHAKYPDYPGYTGEDPGDQSTKGATQEDGG